MRSFAAHGARALGSSCGATVPRQATPTLASCAGWLLSLQRRAASVAPSGTSSAGAAPLPGAPPQGATLPSDAPPGLTAPAPPPRRANAGFFDATRLSDEELITLICSDRGVCSRLALPDFVRVLRHAEALRSVPGMPVPPFGWLIEQACTAVHHSSFKAPENQAALVEIAALLALQRGGPFETVAKKALAGVCGTHLTRMTFCGQLSCSQVAKVAWAYGHAQTTSASSALWSAIVSFGLSNVGSMQLADISRVLWGLAEIRYKGEAHTSEEFFQAAADTLVARDNWEGATPVELATVAGAFCMTGISHPPLMKWLARLATRSMMDYLPATAFPKSLQAAMEAGREWWMEDTFTLRGEGSSGGAGSGTSGLRGMLTGGSLGVGHTTRSAAPPAFDQDFDASAPPASVAAELAALEAGSNEDEEDEGVHGSGSSGRWQPRGKRAPAVTVEEEGVSAYPPGASSTPLEAYYGEASPPLVAGGGGGARAHLPPVAHSSLSDADDSETGGGSGSDGEDSVASSSSPSSSSTWAATAAAGLSIHAILRDPGSRAELLASLRAKSRQEREAALALLAHHKSSGGEASTSPRGTAPRASRPDPSSLLPKRRVPASVAPAQHAAPGSDDEEPVGASAEAARAAAEASPRPSSSSSLPTVDGGTARSFVLMAWALAVHGVWDGPFFAVFRRVYLRMFRQLQEHANNAPRLVTVNLALQLLSPFPHLALGALSVVPPPEKASGAAAGSTSSSGAVQAADAETPDEMAADSSASPSSAAAAQPLLQGVSASDGRPVRLLDPTGRLLLRTDTRMNRVTRTLDAALQAAWEGLNTDLAAAAAAGGEWVPPPLPAPVPCYFTPAGQKLHFAFPSLSAALLVVTPRECNPRQSGFLPSLLLELHCAWGSGWDVYPLSSVDVKRCASKAEREGLVRRALEDVQDAYWAKQGKPAFWAAWRAATAASAACGAAATAAAPVLLTQEQR